MEKRRNSAFFPNFLGKCTYMGSKIKIQQNAGTPLVLPEKMKKFFSFPLTKFPKNLIFEIENHFQYIIEDFPLA
jgi:hypothetical protein